MIQHSGLYEKCIMSGGNCLYLHILLLAVKLMSHFQVPQFLDRLVALKLTYSSSIDR